MTKFTLLVYSSTTFEPQIACTTHQLSVSNYPMLFGTIEVNQGPATYYRISRLMFKLVLTVTVARRPSGTFATMIPIRKMTASSQLYPRIRDRIKKDTPRKTATPVIMWMKCSISIEMGVRPTSRPDARVAIRPITVRSPVLITIPLAVPKKKANIVY